MTRDAVMEAARQRLKQRRKRARDMAMNPEAVREREAAKVKKHRQRLKPIRPDDLPRINHSLRYVFSAIIPNEDQPLNVDDA